MSNGIYTALSGAVAQSTALDVTSNNVANAGTTGYHAERMRFSQVLQKAKDCTSVRAAAGGTDPTEGTFVSTGNPLDAAVRKDGFFGLNTPQGTRYTKAGAFSIDAKRQLVSAQGFPVRGAQGKPIVVPPDAASISIGGDGSVHAGDTEVGKIEISRFTPNAMSRAGGALFTAKGAPITTGAAPEVVPGSLEEANFNVVHGVVDLVRISRTYETLHRMIESYKDIDDRAARSIGGQ